LEIYEFHIGIRFDSVNLLVWSGNREQGTGDRGQVTGYRLQVTGYRLQVTGYSDLIPPS